MKTRRHEIPSMNGADIMRFSKKVSILGRDECWEWTAGRFKKTQYGMFSIRGYPVLAHRAAYWIENGNLPENILVCHTCDNKICCNPNHLFLGTHLDNNRDRHNKGRDAKGDNSGPRKYKERMPRGEKNKRSKLTDEKIRIIRQLHEDGLSIGKISKNFKVTHRTISLVIRRITWWHVQD